jgi:hypothetical protein
MPRPVLAGVAVLVAAAAAWFWPTDARRIRATLDTAVEAVSTAAGERELERVARAASLARALAPDVVVETAAGGPAVRGRETVVGVASRIGVGGPLAVTLEGVELTIDGEAGRATATGFARVSGAGASEAGRYDGAEIRIDLTKIDGAWLIARISPAPTISR